MALTYSTYSNSIVSLILLPSWLAYRVVASLGAVIGTDVSHAILSCLARSPAWVWARFGYRDDADESS
jgi:hypothetical protein